MRESGLSWDTLYFFTFPYFSENVLRFSILYYIFHGVTILGWHAKWRIVNRDDQNKIKYLEVKKSDETKESLIVRVILFLLAQLTAESKSIAHVSGMSN